MTKSRKPTAEHKPTTSLSPEQKVKRDKRNGKPKGQRDGQDEKPKRDPWKDLLPFFMNVRRDCRMVREFLPLQSTPIADDLRIGDPGYRTKKKGGSPPPDYNFIELLADLEHAINTRDLETAMYSAICLKRFINWED